MILSKVIEGHKSSSNFIVNPTLTLLDGPLMLPSPNCVDLSLSIFLSLSLSFSLFLSLSLYISFSLPLSLSYSLSISLSVSRFCSMQSLIYTQRNVFHKMKYDLKGHMRTLLYDF